MAGPAHAKHIARLIVGVAGLVLAEGCAHHKSAAVADYVKPVSNESYQTAIATFRAQREADPNDLTALLGLSRALRYDGQSDVALKTLKSAKGDLAQNPEYLAELGKVSLVTGDVRGARRALAASVDRGVADWQAYSALGVANDLNQKYDEALAAYDHALVMCPDSAPILNNKALSVTADGDIESGVRLMKKAYHIEPRSERIAENLAALQTLEINCIHCSRDKMKEMARSIYPSDWTTNGDGPLCDPNHLMAGDIVKAINDKNFVDLRVNFEFDSAKLLPAAKEALDELGRALTTDQLAESSFRLEGHTDAVGTEAYNMGLSKRRANSVKSYLIKTLGIDAKRLTAEGYGESRLLDPEHPTSGVNRRVRVVRVNAEQTPGTPPADAPGPMSSR